MRKVRSKYLKAYASYVALAVLKKPDTLTRVYRNAKKSWTRLSRKDKAKASRDISRACGVT